MQTQVTHKDSNAHLPQSFHSRQLSCFHSDGATAYGASVLERESDENAKRETVNNDLIIKQTHLGSQ